MPDAALPASAIAHTVEIGLILIDSASSVRFWNQWMVRTSGLRSEDALGKGLPELFPELTGGRLIKAVAAALSYGMTARLSPALHGSPLPLRGCDPQHAHFERIQQQITVKPLKTENAERWCLIQISDMTASAHREQLLHAQAAEQRRLAVELRQKAERLTRSNDAFEEFGYVVAHDLKAPLRGISGLSELIARKHGAELTEPAREQLQTVTKTARRMSELINALLGYTQVRESEEEFVAVDLGELAEEVRSDLSAHLANCSGQLEIGPLPVVLGVRVRLGQLLQNLIENGLKFAGETAPRVQISAEEREGRAWVCVSDDGIGIDPKDHERIFAVFQRLHLPEQYAGTGIGLSLCKKIVEQHGGRIRVSSERGKGASFSFDLPLPGASGA